MPGVYNNIVPFLIIFMHFNYVLCTHAYCSFVWYRNSMSDFISHDNDSTPTSVYFNHYYTLTQ